MKLEEYFSDPPDRCERLISGLEYCLEVEEVEIDETEILFAILEKGLFYRGMFQNFTTIPFLDQIKILCDNFTEFGSNLCLPSVEIQIFQPKFQIVEAIVAFVKDLSSVSRQSSCSILVECSLELFIVHIKDMVPAKILILSRDVEHINIGSNQSLKQALRAFFHALLPDDQRKYLSVHIAVIFNRQKYSNSLTDFTRHLESLRKFNQIQSILCVRKMINYMEQRKNNDKNSLATSQVKLRQSFLQQFLQSNDSEDLESYGLRAYQAIRENILAGGDWHLQEDEKNETSINPTHPESVTHSITAYYLKDKSDGDESGHEELIGCPTTPKLSDVANSSEILFGKELSSSFDQDSDLETETNIESQICQAPSEWVNDEKLSEFFRDINRLLSSELDKIKLEKISKQSCRTTVRLDAGKKIFLQIQSAAIARRKRTNSGSRQIPEVKIPPPIPRWSESESQVHLNTSLDHPQSDEVDEKSTAQFSSDVTSTKESPKEIHGQENKFKSVSSEPVSIREQLIRERGRQHALNLWNQKCQEKKMLPESDNYTVVSTVSGQSTITESSKNRTPCPKRLDIYLNQDSVLTKDDVKEQRIVKSETKKKKADEIVEREKLKQASKVQTGYQQRELIRKRGIGDFIPSDFINCTTPNNDPVSERNGLQEGYLRTHLDGVEADLQINRLETEVAQIDTSKGKSKVRSQSADLAQRRIQSEQSPDHSEKNQSRASSATSRNSSRANSSRANSQQVRNALVGVCLAGPHQSQLRDETLSAMDFFLKDEKVQALQFVIVMHQSKMLSFKGLYLVDASGEIRRISGRGPKVLPLNVIEEYYKYESSTRSFRKLPTTTFNSTCDAVTVDPTKIKKLTK